MKLSYRTTEHAVEICFVAADDAKVTEARRRRWSIRIRSKDQHRMHDKRVYGEQLRDLDVPKQRSEGPQVNGFVVRSTGMQFRAITIVVTELCFADEQVPILQSDEIRYLLSQAMTAGIWAVVACEGGVDHIEGIEMMIRSTRIFTGRRVAIPAVGGNYAYIDECALPPISCCKLPKQDYALLLNYPFLPGHLRVAVVGLELVPDRVDRLKAACSE